MQQQFFLRRFIGTDVGPQSCTTKKKVSQSQLLREKPIYFNYCSRNASTHVLIALRLKLKTGTSFFGLIKIKLSDEFIGLTIANNDKRLNLGENI